MLFKGFASGTRVEALEPDTLPCEALKAIASYTGLSQCSDLQALLLYPDQSLNP